MQRHKRIRIIIVINMTTGRTAMEAFFSPSLALVDELAPDNGDVVSLVSFIDTFALSNEDFCISERKRSSAVVRHNVCCSQSEVPIPNIDS